MGVPEHLVAEPAAKNLDDVAVNARIEEGHGTSGVDGAVGHVLEFEF